jgi:2-keto-3-deoxy-L-rhamnonate aldolase RhmA
MINYMMVTNDPFVARQAELSGVPRIFIDLEINGKQERQGHLDTFISTHQMSDIAKVKSSLSTAEVLVRLNPLYDSTEHEIDEAIANGADILMLPMFRSAEEVHKFSEYINGRVKFIPLIETKDAALNIKDIVQVKGVTELFIGLNDLHIEYGYSFMFELLSDEVIDDLVDVITQSGLPFGFGGIARAGEGAIPAEAVLAEHLRLGSTATILSRSFRKSGMDGNELQIEINKLKYVVNNLLERSQECIERDKVEFKNSVRSFVLGMQL